LCAILKARSRATATTLAHSVLSLNGCQGKSDAEPALAIGHRRRVSIVVVELGGWAAQLGRGEIHRRGQHHGGQKSRRSKIESSGHGEADHLPFPPGWMPAERTAFASLVRQQLFESKIWRPLRLKKGFSGGN